MAEITSWVANHHNQLVRPIGLSPAWISSRPPHWWPIRPACASFELFFNFELKYEVLRVCDLWLINFDELWPLSNEFISRVNHRFYKLKLNSLKFQADIMDLTGIMRSIFKWDYQDSPKNRIESYRGTIKFCNGSYYSINITIIIWKYAHFYQNGNDLFLVQGNITVTIIATWYLL